MAIREFQLKVVCTGAAGTAAGAVESSSAITGLVQAVHIEYSGAPATTDVVINGEGPPDIPILTVSDNNTSGWYYPRAGAHKASDGAAMTYDGTYPVAVPIPLCGNTIKVAADQADNGAEITVTIRYDDMS